MSDYEAPALRALLRTILTEGYATVEPQPERGRAWLVVDMSTGISLDDAALIDRILAEGDG